MSPEEQTAREEAEQQFSNGGIAGLLIWLDWQRNLLEGLQKAKLKGLEKITEAFEKVEAALVAILTSKAEFVPSETVQNIRDCADYYKTLQSKSRVPRGGLERAAYNTCAGIGKKLAHRLFELGVAEVQEEGNIYLHRQTKGDGFER